MSPFRNPVPHKPRNPPASPHPQPTRPTRHAPASCTSCAGNSYYKPISQFSKGEYPGANNQQDDYAIMAQSYLPYLPDDHSNYMALASNLGGTISVADATRSTASAFGRIGCTDDSDWLVFWGGAGDARVTVDVTPVTIGEEG